jgi:predicted dehydrogenase
LANQYVTEPAIRGDEGTLTLQNAGGWEGGFDSITIIPAKGTSETVPGLKTEATPLHWKNFIHCVRTREKPVSDVEFALKVQAALNMSMLALLNKKVAQFDCGARKIIL